MSVCNYAWSCIRRNFTRLLNYQRPTTSKFCRVIIITIYSYEIIWQEVKLLTSYELKSTLNLSSEKDCFTIFGLRSKKSWFTKLVIRNLSLHHRRMAVSHQHYIFMNESCDNKNWIMEKIKRSSQDSNKSISYYHQLTCGKGKKVLIIGWRAVRINGL